MRPTDEARAELSVGRGRSLQVLRRRIESILIDQLRKLQVAMAMATLKIRHKIRQLRYQGRPPDKASTLRLVINYIRMKWALAWQPSESTSSKLLNLSVAPKSIITYTVAPATVFLRVFGTSIYEWCHPNDHGIFQRVLNPDTKSLTQKTRQCGSGLVRLKQSLLVDTGSTLVYPSYDVYFVGNFLPRDLRNLAAHVSLWVSWNQPQRCTRRTTTLLLTLSRQYVVATFFSHDLKYATFSFLHRVPICTFPFYSAFPAGSS